MRILKSKIALDKDPMCPCDLRLAIYSAFTLRYQLIFKYILNIFDSDFDD